MALLNCNGWTIYSHPLFIKDYTNIEARVFRLKKTLPDKKYRQHETVKFYAAIVKAIEEKIPLNPLAEKFLLGHELQGYCRVKGMGIPDRYRLFFKAFEDKKLIFILWLGYPRKEGSKDDCYRVFKKMIDKGKFPASPEELIKDCITELQIS